MSRRKLMSVLLWLSLIVAALVYWNHIQGTIKTTAEQTRLPLKRGSFGSSWRRHIADNLGRRWANMTCEQVMKTRNISMHRFVMGLYYWEQLNMATGNLFSLVHVARDLKARTVIPFTKNSRLYGLPNFCADYTWSESRNHPLNLIYDVPKLNRLSCSFELPPFAPLQSFMESAKRDLIVVHFIHTKQARDQNLAAVSSSELKAHLAGRSMAECSGVPHVQKLSTNITRMVNSVAMKFQSQPFQIINYICVNASHSIRLPELVEKAGLTGDFSLVFVTWRGISDTSLIKNAATGEHVSQRIHLTEISERPLLTPSLINMPFSSTAWENGSHMLASIVGNKPFIGIHFRSEKLGQRNNRMPGFLARCLERTLHLQDNLLAKENATVPQVLVFVDYGKHGSNSCRNCKGAKMLRNALDNYKITPVHFIPHNGDAVNDSGFTAVVELGVLARAKHLILVGGGAFQKQTALEFRNQTMHNIQTTGQKSIKRSVYRVCWDDLGRVKRLKI